MQRAEEVSAVIKPSITSKCQCQSQEWRITKLIPQMELIPCYLDIYTVCVHIYTFTIYVQIYIKQCHASQKCVFRNQELSWERWKFTPHSPIFGECCESQNATSAAHNPHLVRIRSSIYKYCHYFVKTWYMNVWSTQIIIIIQNSYFWTCLDVDIHPTKTSLFTSTKLWNSEESQNKSFDSVNRPSIKLVQFPLKEMHNKYYI